MYNNVFAARLKKLMQETKTTQQALAKEINITRQAISQYTDGSALPNIEKLEKISNYFNVSCDYLVGKTNVKTHDLSPQKVITALIMDEMLSNLCDAINILDDINDGFEELDIDTTEFPKGVDIINKFYKEMSKKFCEDGEEEEPDFYHIKIQEELDRRNHGV